jgi:hypothetical protein
VLVELDDVIKWLKEDYVNRSVFTADLRPYLDDLIEAIKEKFGEQNEV